MDGESTLALALGQPNRERKSSVAQSIRFNHARSSSISSIDEELFQPPSRIMNRERGSFESLSSSRNIILDEIDHTVGSPLQQQLSQQQRASSLFFKNLNNSSSTLVPLTRTVSFNSIHNGSPVSSSEGLENNGGGALDSSGSTKTNRLTRLFTTRNSKSGNGEVKSGSRGAFSPSRASISLSTNGNSLGKNGSKSNLLQRQISVSRSIKEKRNVKKPVDLSIQTSNLASSIPERGNSIELKDGEGTLTALPNLTDALSYLHSLASPQLTSTSTLTNPSKSRKHHHLHINHHNLLRSRNRDNPLSSSSSNSQLISDTGETLYSFSVSGSNLSTSDLQRTFQQLESLNFKDLELYGDKAVMGDECFSLLCISILPIFKGDSLKVPIEDLNRLVQLFLYLRIQDFHSNATPTKTAPNAAWSSSHRAISVFEEIQSLLEQGFNRFNEAYISRLANISAESKVIKSWNIFKSNILFYLEGIFLPLQLELQGNGILIKPESHRQIWNEMTLQQDLDEFDVKRLILKGFRDIVIIPIYENDEEENWIHDDVQSGDEEGAKHKARVAVLQQCFSILERIKSHDSSQNLIDRLLKDILEKST